MKQVVISCIFRPHIVEEGTECWCKPRIMDCTCDEGCGSVAVHRFLEPWPDKQARMSSFSEQRVL
jgi:hypothetical protein